MVNQQFSQLIKGCPPLSQSRLAEKAEVNRGQFNAWLKNGNNLSDEKVVALIRVLVAWLDRDGADFKTRYDKLIQEILAFPAYQAAEVLSFPKQPVPAGHPTYIERATESQLARLFELPPVDVAVLGGPKMGKTSLLNWLQQNLRHKHSVLRCDFRNLEKDPLRAMDLAAKAVGLGGARLRDWMSFPDWARRTLLTGSKPCTLILDHVQCLTPEPLSDLQDGLHHLVNMRRDEPVLDRLNLVLAYDEASPAMRDAQLNSSGMTRDFRSMVLLRFNESQVELLLQPILKITDKAELEALVEKAWAFFQGHPFLTHLWADSLSGQKGRYDADAALRITEGEAQEPLFQPFKETLEESTHGVLQAALANEGGAIENENVSALARLWLQDSGLFDVKGLGKQASIGFPSDWIRIQLAIALGTKS